MSLTYEPSLEPLDTSADPGTWTCIKIRQGLGSEVRKVPVFTDG